MFEKHMPLEKEKFSYGQVRPRAAPPGEDYNCRCWAEAIEEEGGGEISLRQEVVSFVNDKGKWSTERFLMHFAIGRGRTVTLEECGYLQDIIDKTQKIVFEKVENQIASKMQEIQNGNLIYTTSGSYPFGDIQEVFGRGTVNTRAEGTVKKRGNYLTIDAVVVYKYSDTFTDPMNIRQEKYGTSSPEGIGSWELMRTDYGGRYFDIIGSWKTELKGSIKFRE